jgi:hypothetical protein
MYFDSLAVLCSVASLFIRDWFAGFVYTIVADLFGFCCVYSINCGYGHQDQYASPCYKIKYSHLIFLYSAGIAAAAGPIGLAPKLGATAGAGMKLLAVFPLSGALPKLGAGADAIGAGGV